jgi:hypothetical protein
MVCFLLFSYTLILDYCGDMLNSQPGNSTDLELLIETSDLPYYMLGVFLESVAKVMGNQWRLLGARAKSETD